MMADSVSKYMEINVETLKGIHFTDLTGEVQALVDDSGVKGT